MTQLLWCTDIHLDHLPFQGGGARVFGACMAEENPDCGAMVLTGDISEAPHLAMHLQQLADGFGRPIYFVLGNHDYYKGSFQEVDFRIAAIRHPGLVWLRQSPLFDGDWALVGNGGWYDGRYGDALGTRVAMSDWALIADLAVTTQRQEIMAIQRQRADLLATELRAQLQAAVDGGAARIVVATHVPPYKEACWHEGKTSDDQWAPWFTSGATGAMLDEAAAIHPDRDFIVLCGHTHSPGIYERRSNLRVYTGKALYGAPDRAGLLEMGRGSVECDGAER